MPVVIPPTTPAFTLVANLKSILGVDSAGYLEITLCGFGPVQPSVGGMVLADAGVPQLVGPGPNITQLLWGNDQINPPGTFYCISVLDAKKNVVQAANYSCTGTGNILGGAGMNPILAPYGFPIGDLAYQQCGGPVPGNVYVAPGPIIAVTYNGMVISEGTSGLTWSRGSNNQINLNFMTQPGDVIYAFVIL